VVPFSSLHARQPTVLTNTHICGYNQVACASAIQGVLFFGVDAGCLAILCRSRTDPLPACNWIHPLRRVPMQTMGPWDAFVRQGQIGSRREEGPGNFIFHYKDKVQTFTKGNRKLTQTRCRTCSYLQCEKGGG